jgi:hypothetical protein
MNRSLGGLVAVALAAAGCSMPAFGPTPAPPAVGEARVVKVERRGWNEPDEPGLYRVRFDAPRTREIARQASDLIARDGTDRYYAEIAALEMEAERELKARGLCTNTVKLASPVDTDTATGGIGGIFRCLPALF